ncbi:MAG: hypothetical protein MUP27_12620, partial [Desulfobacterales bacterium]|nr:hypothetical protein [Desulfobacterales bacterium]
MADSRWLIEKDYKLSAISNQLIGYEMLTGVEIKRKIVHLATLIIPIGYALTSEKTILTFLLPFF